MRRELPLLAALLAVVGLAILSSFLGESSAGVPDDSSCSIDSDAAVVAIADAVEPSVERVAVAAPTNPRSPSVRIVDARNGAAVIDADLRIAVQRADVVEWATGRSDANGVVVFDDRHRLRAVAVTAAGYAPVLVQWPTPPESRSTIRMQPGASLTIRFVDAAGAPVVGVAARLLPPLASGREWGADWRPDADAKSWTERLVGYTGPDLCALVADGLELSAGRVVAPEFDCMRRVLARATSSDANGVVRFVDLPASRDWRWAIASSHHADVQPPHESLPGAGERGGVGSNSGPRVRDLSGPLVLAAGEATELTVMVHSAATLSGRIPATGYTLRPQIKLYHVSKVAGPAGKEVFDVAPEAFMTTGEDGTFRFENVRPGPKVLRAWWRRELDYVFASRTVLLRAGERHDLGAVEPLPASVAVQVDLRDRDDRVLAVDHVLGDATPRAIVHVEAWRKLGALADSVLEAVAVPLGSVVRFHGFAPGRLRIRSTRGLDWPQPREAARRIVDSPAREVELPTGDRVLLPITVETRVVRDLTLVTAASTLPTLEVWLRPLRGGSPERIRVGRADSASRRTLSLSVVPEPYEVLVLSPDASEGEGLVGAGRIDFSLPEQTWLSLCAGGSVAGTCLCADGKPLANAPLYWTADGWRIDDQDVWLFRSRTDAGGRFALHGLPPGISLRGARDGTGFTVPHAGGQARVQIIARR